MNRAVEERRHQKGASLVEFAIVLPLLLLLIGGMVDLGRAFYTEVMLTNAAREGARSAMYSTTEDFAVKRAEDAGGNPNFTAAVTTSCPATATNPPSRATVTVTDSDFEWIVLGPAINIVTLGSGGAFLPTTLTAKATMQCGG